MLRETIIRTLVIVFVASCCFIGKVSSSNSNDLNIVYLKSEREILIHSNRIMLSDIFTGIQPSNDKVVANAPQPGKSLKLFSQDVRALAKRSKLTWRPVLKRTPLIISRASRMVSLNSLRNVLIERLQKQFLNDDVEIEFSNPRLKIYVPENAEVEINVIELRYNDQTRQFQAIISPSKEIIKTQQVSVRGRAHAIISMPVLKKHLGAGKIIQAQDIGWRKFRAEQGGFDIIGSIDGLIDQISKRPIIAGRLIRHSDVKPQRLVKKGDFVTIHFKNRAMSLSTRGISIESGTRDQVIKVRNPRSKRIIEARVIAPNVAVVLPPAALISRN